MHRARLSHYLVALTLLLTLLLGATAPATAQSWPTRPVKFILTLGPEAAPTSVRGCWRTGWPRNGASRS